MAESPDASRARALERRLLFSELDRVVSTSPDFFLSSRERTVELNQDILDVLIAFARSNKRNDLAHKFYHLRADLEKLRD